MPLRALGASIALLALAGCAAVEAPPGTAPFPRLGASEGRALVERLLPDRLADRSGWATDLYAAIAALNVAPTAENVCAAIAIAEQESGLRVDPPVPGLPAIARKELDARREQAGVPKLVLDAALALPSSNGKSYGERLDSGKSWVVRQRHAHAWCLAYVDGSWRDFDVTPATWVEAEESRAAWTECPSNALTLENMLMFYDEVRDRLQALGIMSDAQIDEQQRLLRALSPVGLPAVWGIHRVVCMA